MKRPFTLYHFLNLVTLTCRYLHIVAAGKLVCLSDESCILKMNSILTVLIQLQCIGDAMVDGATLKWDIYKPFDGLSEEEVQHLSMSDVELLKEKAMCKNAWAVAEQICVRIDEAKGPGGGYLHAYVSNHPGI